MTNVVNLSEYRSQSQATAEEAAAKAAAEAVRGAGAEFDLLVNLTDMQEHERLNKQAIAAGKHVWSEKPMANSLAATSHAAKATTRAAAIRSGSGSRWSGKAPAAPILSPSPRSFSGWRAGSGPLTRRGRPGSPSTWAPPCWWR